jgi:transposase
MFYVGLDIHTKQVTICVLDSDGKLVQRAQVRQLDELKRFLERLGSPFEVCYEASCGYGCYYELLSPIANRVVVAHPGMLKLIFRSKQKNDRRDAEKLAKLLYLGEVPQVHVPKADVRAWREMIAFRRRLIEKRTRAKNGVRGLLRAIGLVSPKRPNLWSNAGMTWLKELTIDSPMRALKRDLLVDEIEQLTRQIDRVERELERFSKVNPAVLQLQTIPGVGLRTAEAIVAFLDDPRRFARGKQVGAYFGLVPSQDQSGGTNRLGHITRRGSTAVRGLLAEAAWQAVRRSPSVRCYFERIQRGDPDRKKIALVATAHYLSRVMWSMLKNGTVWRESVQAA